MSFNPDDLSSDQLFFEMETSFRRKTFWPEFFSRPAFLYQALHTLVKSQSMPEGAIAWIEKSEVHAKNSGTLDGWYAARLLVRCAVEANDIIKERSKQNPPPKGSTRHQEIDAGINSLVALPDSITEMIESFPASIRSPKEYEDFARKCIHSFHSIPIQRLPLRVPVVSWNKKVEGGGKLATLVLETLEPGNSTVYQHPMDAFSTSIGREFKAAMENAWSAAKSLLNEEAAKSVSGRWRFLEGWHPVKEQESAGKVKGKVVEAPVLSVDGESAGAAAAWGWYHALKGTAYDQRVIVSAVNNKDGTLSMVDGITAKVRAIVADERLDTFVVASTANKKEAVEALQKKGNLVLKKEKPTKDSPGCKYFLRLPDRVLKIVNLAPDDPCVTEQGNRF